MSTESDVELSDSDIDENSHQKLIQNVLNLNKIQHLKKPSRTESSREISEFNLLKSISDYKSAVHVRELAKVLDKKKKNLGITRILKEKGKKLKTLPKPLPEHVAQQINRTVHYEKNRLKLDKWEGSVTANRVAQKLYFPLDSVEKLKVIEKRAEEYPSTFRLKTDLQKELEKLNPQDNKNKSTEEEKETETYFLTLAELKEKRKEAAKLRAHQSFKEAKERFKNKIKSKKYRRLLKKQKIKQTLKEFEELQMTNPEEALKKLEEIEKIRAQERFSLRHRGTGQWAKNQQIRAKYDKESRQALAEQLTISRELTQKSKTVNSDSDEEEMGQKPTEFNSKIEENNPWTNGVKPDKEVEEFLSGYRKYWEGVNKEQENKIEILNDKLQSEKTEAKIKTNHKEDKLIEANGKDDGMLNIGKKTKRNKTKKNNVGKKLKEKSSGDWEVTKLDENFSLDDIFDKLEEKMGKKLKEKSLKILKDISSIKENDDKPVKMKTKRKSDLSMPFKVKKQIIDEELLEKPNGNELESENTDIAKLKNILAINNKPTQQTADINPANFMKPKTTILNTAIPDILATDDNEESDQRTVITEAFEDDDVVDEFKKEKEKIIEDETPKDINLELPGWGQWAGASIDSRKRKRKRLILKAPPPAPRKDDNKGSLIINAKGESKIKPLLVNEIPFPFTSVKDYEASVRAPIGNTFVPETAYKKLIEPAIVTKMGSIIEPITKNYLIGKKN